MKKNTLNFFKNRQDARINWYGRCFHNPQCGNVSFSASSSGFEVAFYGTTLMAKIQSNGSFYTAEASGSAYIYVFIDGETDYHYAIKKELIADDEVHLYILADGLSMGLHRVKVLKCTEVKYGVAYLSEIMTDGEFFSPPLRPRYKSELVGDSILSGSESMRTSLKDSMLTISENSLAAYGYIAASIVGAEVNAVTRSGALVSGYRGFPKIGDEYDVYTSADRYTWDFSLYKSDFIIVDLGTNDSILHAPRELIKESYATLLTHIRTKNPFASIFCCYGALTNAVNDIVELVVGDNDDKKIHAVKLPAYTPIGHPTEKDHANNGTFLAAYISKNLS